MRVAAVYHGIRPVRVFDQERPRIAPSDSRSGRACRCAGVATLRAAASIFIRPYWW